MQVGPRLGNAIVVRCYSSRRTAQGLSRRVYTAQEIDAFAVYCPDVDRCYWIPFGVIAASSEMRLRLEPTRNNQRHLVNWAKDYEFAARLGRYGAIAQLGERMPGRHEVAGSSPAGSTLTGRA